MKTVHVKLHMKTVHVKLHMKTVHVKLCKHSLFYCSFDFIKSVKKNEWFFKPQKQTHILSTLSYIFS